MGWGETKSTVPVGKKAGPVVMPKTAMDCLDREHHGVAQAAITLSKAVDQYLRHSTSNNREIMAQAQTSFERTARRVVV